MNDRAYTEAKRARFIQDLDAVLGDLRGFLIDKNRAYGDSALNPVRILTKADPRDLILARIDDKLKRLLEGESAGEDVWKDLLGYFVLLAIFDMRETRRIRESLEQALPSDDGRTRLPPGQV